jgi:hypothetical protein
MLIFNNPAGFWALLAIPAILGIHFLQRKSIVLPISTLFLLDQMQRESVSGRRVERLRSSIPLWLQLLMALLLTWILVQPRWMEKSSVQRIVVVLDSSLSMQAFRSKLTADLPVQLEKLASLVQTTDYVLMESLVDEDTLYHGTSLSEFTTALKAWNPIAGAHEFSPALRLARSLAETGGLVILATDHPIADLPYDTKTFSVGSALENTGFAGLSFIEKDGQLLWKATLKNYSDREVKRSWWMQMGETKSSPQSITLPPGAAQPIQGIFPPTVNQLTIQSEPDAFSADDALPILRPQPKQLAVVLPDPQRVTPAESQLYQQLFRSLTDVVITPNAATANIQLILYDPLNPALPTDKPALCVVRDSRAELPTLSGSILAEAHPLVEGLNWQSLLCLDSVRIPMKATDRPLLWQGERCLIFLRGEGLSQQLCFNFDLRYANAHKLPAFVVINHRFLESIRDRLPLREVRNCEAGEALTVAAVNGDQQPPLTLNWREGTSEKSQTFALSQRSLLKAPPTPGEFYVRQGEVELLHGATHFADTREADFRKAASLNELTNAKAALATALAREDSTWQLAVLLTLAAALASWWFAQQRKESGSEVSAQGV